MAADDDDFAVAENSKKTPNGHGSPKRKPQKARKSSPGNGFVDSIPEEAGKQN